MPLAIVEASPEPTTLVVGSAGPDFEGLLGADGRRYGLSTFSDKEIVVLVFSSNRCPTAKAYAERLNGLQRTYGSRGVQVLAVNANDPHLYPDESYRRMVELAAGDAYTFPYVVDEGQSVARAYGARCTFHVFVLDRERRLRYEGRFDNSRIPAQVTRHDVINALDDILAGRDVAIASTRAFGCSLDFV